MQALISARRAILDFAERYPIFTYTLFAFALIWFAQFGTAKTVFLTGYIRDTDDAMRLVQVRDFIAGQNWFDLHQYRVNPPHGLLMHWSRLIDVPVALLIRFFEFFTDAEMAERLARLTLPALIQFGFFAALLATTTKLAGRAALFAAAVLTGFNQIISMQMEPGRVDHHHALLLLSMLAVLSTLTALKRPQFAVFAGICGAAMLAIGFESLPVIAVTGLFYVWLWVRQQPHAGESLRNFGLGLATAAISLYLATTPPALYRALACDAQSYASTLLAAAAGLCCWLLFMLETRLHTFAQRLAAVIFFGIALTAVFYIYAQPCLTGPFAALPEDLREKWLNHVFEAMGLHKHLQGDFWNMLPFLGPLLVSFGCVLTAFYFEKSNRWRWGLLLALASAHLILSFVHIRMVSYAILFALPAGAWCITRLRERSQGGMALLYILLVPSAWALAAQPFAKPIPEPSTCGEPANYKAIAELPKATVLAPIDLGPFLLAYTPHAVYGAPYHRNIEGMRTVFATLYEPPATALPKLREKKVNYIILCDALGEQRTMGPDSLGTRLMKGETFSVLQKLADKPPMHVWRVR